jgi:hypothetical protein
MSSKPFINRLTIAGLAIGFVIPGAAFAYGEKDAIRDCENRIRSEYGLSDMRDASATQLNDSEKHFKVQGRTKVEGDKYSWTCEVKDRHVTSINYDGPKPEGLGTAEKLAIGAAAAIAVGAAASAMSKDKEPEAVTESVAAPRVQTRSSGEMEVVFADGCTVLYNDIGLRQQQGSSCSQEDLKQAERAMTAHLNAQ